MVGNEFGMDFEWVLNAFGMDLEWIFGEMTGDHRNLSNVYKIFRKSQNIIIFFQDELIFDRDY